MLHLYSCYGVGLWLQAEDDLGADPFIGAIQARNFEVRTSDLPAYFGVGLKFLDLHQFEGVAEPDGDLFTNS